MIYGFSKVHKQLLDDFPPLASILSALKTPAYKLTKFLAPVLISIVISEYAVKDSFPSLNTRTKHMSIYRKLAFKDFGKNELRLLLHLATKESNFSFDETLYKKVDGGCNGITTWTSFGQWLLGFLDVFIQIA